MGHIFYVSIDNDNNKHFLSLCFASDIVLGLGDTELKKEEALNVKEFSINRKLNKLNKQFLYLVVSDHSNHICLNLGAPMRVTPPPVAWKFRK